MEAAERATVILKELESIGDFLHLKTSSRILHTYRQQGKVAHLCSQINLRAYILLIHVAKEHHIQGEAWWRLLNSR